MTSCLPNFIGFGKKMTENLFGKRKCKLEKKRRSRRRGYDSYEPDKPFVALLLLLFRPKFHRIRFQEQSANSLYSIPVVLERPRHYHSSQLYSTDFKLLGRFKALNRGKIPFLALTIARMTSSPIRLPHPLVFIPSYIIVIFQSIDPFSMGYGYLVNAYTRISDV